LASAAARRRVEHHALGEDADLARLRPPAEHRRRGRSAVDADVDRTPGSGCTNSLATWKRVVELGIDRLPVVDRAELIVDEAADLVVVAGEGDDQALVIARRQVGEVLGLGVEPARLPVEVDAEMLAVLPCSFASTSSEMPRFLLTSRS
jgi:hypothetical protein